MKIQTVNVPVVFELEFSPASEDLVPCLVGSLKELGTWNRLNGLVAKKLDKDSSKWTVELEIPQMSFFFFNWVLTKKGQFYEEEPTGCRKANVGVFGGVFYTEYGEKWTEFSSFCGCQISVSTHFALNYDEQIVVMGSGKLLGDWKTWVPAASDDPVTSVWTAKFELEQGTTEEFKWVILDRQSREIRRWQEGENRIIKIETGLKSKNVFVPWGGRYVKEGLIIPAVVVVDWSDYHPQRLFRSFAIDCMIGHDDGEIETNNSNVEDPKLVLELVTKIPSGARGQHVGQEFLKSMNNSDLLTGAFGSIEVTEFDLIQLSFTVDVLAEVISLKEFINDGLLQLQLTSLAVTGPFTDIILNIEDKIQLGPPSFQNSSNLLKPSRVEPRTSSSDARFYFNHDKTIISRVPILDNDTNLLERVIDLGESLEVVDRVASLDGALDIEDRVAVLDGSLDEGTIGMEITYSDDMVTQLQNTQVQVAVNTEQDWSGPRKALYSIFTGLSNFYSSFVF